MNVTGIPFKLTIPSSEEIVSITIDDIPVEYTVRIYGDTKIITSFGTSNNSVIRISTKSPQYGTNIRNGKIAILQTDFNVTHVKYWEQFVKDFIGIIPVRLNDSNNFDCLIDYTLIIAPNVLYLDNSKIDELKSAVKNGTGLIVTSHFPNDDLLGLLIDEKTIPHVGCLMADKEHIAMMPFTKNESISFDGGALNITNKGSEVLASIVCNDKQKKSNDLIERSIRYLRGGLIYFGFNLDLLNLQYRFFNKIGLLRKAPAILTNKFGKGKVIYLSFDPVYITGSDSRKDQGVKELSKHSNLLHLAISAIICASSAIFSKGLYKEDKVPIIYSIDTEASLSYFNPTKNMCSHCELYGGTDCDDTKMEKCLIRAAERLENFGAVGTFHIDTGGIYDEKDRDALRSVSEKHNISLHMGGDGNHFTWMDNVGNNKYVLENLLDGISTLESIVHKKILGLRYPSWVRTPSTHDILHELDLDYDTSSLACPPFASIPFRMYSNSKNEPLELWELPCREVIGIVKHKPDNVKDKFRKKIAIYEIKRYVEQAYKHQGIVVLADHDMSIGTNPKHIHGTWQFDNSAFTEMMNYCYDIKRFKDLWVVTGSEFINWYSFVRNLKVQEFKIIQNGQTCEYLVHLDPEQTK